MLSNSRGEKQERIEQKNPVEFVTGLINIFHSIKHRVNLSEQEKKKAEELVRSEINSVKSRLPKHFRDNIPHWLNNRDVWLAR
jgi:hypothetical protein